MADAHVGAIEVTKVALGKALIFLPRLLRCQKQRTPGGVLAKQCALGSTQHLHGLEVDGIQQLGVGAGNKDVVDVHTYCGIGSDAHHPGAHAANCEVGFLAALAAGQAGYIGDEVTDTVDLGGAQLIFAEGGNRDGRFLQGFLPAPSRDHDLFQHETVGERQGYRSDTGTRCDDSGGEQAAFGNLVRTKHLILLRQFRYRSRGA